MGYISKAIAASVAAIFTILAVFGIGDGDTIMGLSQDAVLTVLTPLVTFLVTFLAPKNTG